jgi:5'(3')-deoxyribonucleotidase
MKRFNEQWTLAVDSDGVVAHFEKKVAEINKMEFHKIPRGRLWSSIDAYDKNVEPFFESLDLMPDAMELMDFITGNFINYFILTACGYTPKNAAQQKRNWYKRRFGDIIVKPVQSSEDKAKFANANTILIDDRSKSIDPWVRAGGIGVLHTSAADSIAQIKKIVGL